MATGKQLERVFSYNDIELKDIQPKFSPNQVKDIYSNQYPELVNANVNGPTIKNGKAIYTFEKLTGTKG